MSLGELSDALGLDVSTLNRQTAAMTKSGYVERVAGPRGRPGPQVPADRRSARSGSRRTGAPNAAGLRKVLADWSADDVDTFATLLRRFNTDIERLDGRPWPRD